MAAFGTKALVLLHLSILCSTNQNGRTSNFQIVRIYGDGTWREGTGPSCLKLRGQVVDLTSGNCATEVSLSRFDLNRILRSISRKWGNLLVRVFYLLSEVVIVLSFILHFLQPLPFLLSFLLIVEIFFVQSRRSFNFIWDSWTTDAVIHNSAVPIRKTNVLYSGAAVRGGGRIPLHEQMDTGDHHQNVFESLSWRNNTVSEKDR